MRIDCLHCIHMEQTEYLLLVINNSQFLSQTLGMGLHFVPKDNISQTQSNQNWKVENQDQLIVQPSSYPCLNFLSFYSYKSRFWRYIMTIFCITNSLITFNLPLTLCHGRQHYILYFSSFHSFFWVFFCSQNVLLLFIPVLMVICGFFVNGPYALITTAVSADLVSRSQEIYDKDWCSVLHSTVVERVHELVLQPTIISSLVINHSCLYTSLLLSCCAFCFPHLKILFLSVKL